VTTFGGGYAPQQQDASQQLTTPDAFTRPRNAALSYTPFETIRIQDMDEFERNLPKMPLVMQTHDVYHEDWIRLMTDLSLAWTGRLPVPEYSRNGHAPRRSELAGDLLELWNNSFFLSRGVELVLFKGHQRRSGPNAGLIDRHLPMFGEDDNSSDDDSSDSSSEDDSDLSDDDRYGRHRRDKKAEKKRRHREKKLRRKEKEREKRYALYAYSVQM